MIAMRDYIIFDKSIEEIEFADLETLRSRNIAEGLFVEYKSSFPATKKISHSIASFANSHGGWYFVGIETDENNVPINFRGFDLAAHPQPKEHLRNVIVGNINPIPSFYSNLVDIGRNRAILIAFVPRSIEMPHITKDGKIYRRNAEGSDPVPETDRYTIDRMYETGKEFDNYVEKFCQREIEIPETQEQGWLEIYFIAYPPEQLWIKEFYDLANIEEIQTFLNTPVKPFGIGEMGFRFDNISTDINSLIARQISSPAELPYMTLTFQLFRNGNAKLIMPFQYVDVDRLSETPYETSEALEKLLSMIGKENVDMYKILDGWKLFTACLVLLRKYVDLLKKFNWKYSFLVRFSLAETWKHILYFDSKIYENYLDKFGVPVCLENSLKIPDYLRRNFFEEKIPKKDEDLVGLFGHLMAGLRCSPMILSSMIKDWIEYLQKMAHH